MATIIDGKAIAATIRREVASEFSDLRRRFPDAIPPNLSVVTVGERADSLTYVRLKRAAAAEVGIQSVAISLPDSVSQTKLERTIAALDSDEHVHGILVQLPLPSHIDRSEALDAVSAAKDVDGIHPSNFGCLTAHRRAPLFAPCTPLGVMELLRRSGIELAGREAVVVGRSGIVGVPMAHMLMAADATVTMCHSSTRDLAASVRRADVVVAAAGVPKLIRGDWIKPGAAVIDVGTTPVQSATAKGGYRLAGDCVFDEVQQVAGHVTPVPGGVGPMTIAMLLRNTLVGYKRALVRAGCAL